MTDAPDAGGSDNSTLSLSDPAPSADQAPPAVTERPVPSSSKTPRSSREMAGWIAVGTVVAVVAARMARNVLGSSKLQFADYWDMILAFTTPQGGLDVGGLFEFQNHPVVLPQFIYWLNIQVFAGSNRTLGLFVVAVVVVTVVVIARIARLGELDRFGQMAVVLVAGVLLFSESGTWNFVKSMSGTAWLLANLLVLVAVLARSRGRTVLAVVVGVLAAVTYGTGILVWPALVAVGVCLRPPREWWKELPYLIVAAVNYQWYRSGVEDVAVVEPSLGTYFEQTSRVVAYPLDLAGSSFGAIGYLPLLGLPLLALWAAVKVRTPAVAAWVGVAAFSWVACVQITYGRGNFVPVFGDQYRYSSLGALAWISFVALALIAVRHAASGLATCRPRLAELGRGPAPAVVLVLPLVAVGFFAGSHQVGEMHSSRGRLEIGEIAWRFDLMEHAAWINAFSSNPAPVAPRLRAMGHHPFVDGWSLDCGMMDQPIDPDSVDASGVEGAVVAIRHHMLLGNGAFADGWVASDADLDCIVVTGDAGRVIGAGTLHPVGEAHRDIPDGVQRFSAVAQKGNVAYDVYGVRGDGTVVLIAGDITIEGK